jgi:proteic killer suppression protein
MMSRRLPPAIQAVAQRKLRMLDAAASLDELRSPPGNRLEALRADRERQHSIRINQRWRICVIWLGDRCRGVEIVDYH